MKRIITMMTFVLLLWGCKTAGPGTSVKGEGDVVLILNALVSDVSGSRAGIAGGDVIREIDILAFDVEGNFLYRREAFPSGNAYKAIMKEGEDVTIHVFANCRSVLDGHASLLDENEGNDWSAVIRPALISRTPVLESDGVFLLPMWGTKDGVDLVRDVVNNIGAIRMLHSVASADVATTVAKEKFELTEAYLYFAASEGLLAPSPDNYDPAKEEVGNPESPVSMTTTAVMGANRKTGEAIKGQLYMFENDTDRSVPEGGRRHTRMVIGGKYGNSDKVTYYPIDFIGNGELLRVTRNCRYDITITGVNSVGYENADVASMATGVNMDFSVIEWNRVFENIYIDGPDHIALDGRTVILGRYAGKFRSIAVDTSFDTEDISMEFVEDNGTAEKIPNGIKNDRFRVEMMVGSDGGIYAFGVTAQAGYSTASPDSNVQRVRVRAGQIEFDITIVQTGTDAGDWGDGGNEDIEGLS